MTTRDAANSLELTARLNASASTGDIVQLTTTGDYNDVQVSNVNKSVEIKNASGINARIGTASGTNQGFVDCSGLFFNGVRFKSSKFWGGSDVLIDGDPAHPSTGPIYLQGAAGNYTIQNMDWSTSGSYGVKVDGRRAGNALWVENLKILSCNFAATGDDPIQIFGMRNGLIQDCTFTDISSYKYSNWEAQGIPATSRTHADGIHFGQTDGCEVINCDFDGIEWQGIIAGPTGYFAGWDFHINDAIVIDGCTFTNIGGTFVPGAGTATFPAPYTNVGGMCIMIFSADEWIIKNCVGNVNVKSSNSVGFWYSWDNNEVDGQYIYANQVIRQGNNLWKGNTNTEVFGFNNVPQASKDITDAGIYAQVLPLETGGTQTPVLVQGPKVNDGSGTSLAVGSGQGWATPTAGNLILVAAGTREANGDLSISGFTEIARNGADTASRHVEVWGKISAGTESTVTLSTTVSGGLALAVYEFSGVTLTEDVGEVGNFNNTTTTSIGTTAIATVTDSVLLFAAIMLSSATANSSGGWAPWTNSFIGQSGNARIGSAYQIVSASGSYSTTAAWVTAQACRITLAALQATATGDTRSGGGSGVVGLLASGGGLKDVPAGGSGTTTLVGTGTGLKDGTGGNTGTITLAGAGTGGPNTDAAGGASGIMIFINSGAGIVGDTSPKVSARRVLRAIEDIETLVAMDIEERLLEAIPNDLVLRSVD